MGDRTVVYEDISFLLGYLLEPYWPAVIHLFPFSRLLLDQPFVHSVSNSIHYPQFVPFDNFLLVFSLRVTTWDV